MRKELNPYADGLPPEIEQKLARRYSEIFRSFARHADKIDRVTFWGVHDGHSWRNDSPVRGRMDYPLIFDRQLQPKAAFDSVVQIGKQ
jgi:endo-1,4-beta-xylanase